MFGDRPVNGVTAFVLAVSHFLTGYWLIYIPAIAGAVFFIIFKLRSEKGKRFKDELLLRLPVISTLIKQAAFARFSRTLATLQNGGVPLIECLRISRYVMMNQVLEEIIEKTEAKILEGSSLSKELSGSPHIPGLVIRMLTTGENSGNLSEMLNHVAQMYDEDVEKTLARITTLAQPVILIIMGFIVGLVLMGVLLPLTDISSLTMG
jgi:general secretion pathway protein F/type IV pilus assembly protein PilC